MALRGIVINAGESHVVLNYAPTSMVAGAMLTLLAFGGTLLVLTLQWRKARRTPE